eukprot:862499-Amphidinium_carterae.2
MRIFRSVCIRQCSQGTNTCNMAVSHRYRGCMAKQQPLLWQGPAEAMKKAEQSIEFMDQA